MIHHHHSRSTTQPTTTISATSISRPVYCLCTGCVCWTLSARRRRRLLGWASSGVGSARAQEVPTREVEEEGEGEGLRRPRAAPCQPTRPGARFETRPVRGGIWRWWLSCSCLTYSEVFRGWEVVASGWSLVNLFGVVAVVTRNAMHSDAVRLGSRRGERGGVWSVTSRDRRRRLLFEGCLGNRRRGAVAWPRTRYEKKCCERGLVGACH